MRRSLAAVLVALPFAAGAQSTESATDTARASHAATPVDRRGTLGLEVWAGVAHNSPRIGVLGDAPDLDLAIGAVRFTRRLAGTRHVALEYTVDVVPLAVLSRPRPTGSVVHVFCRTRTNCSSAEHDVLLAGNAYGAGISPLGLTAVLRPSRVVELALGGSGGALWFDRRVPTTGATRFNFTATAEASAGLVDEQGRGPFVTYRFHHISNGGRSPQNVAVASNVLSLGLRWRLVGSPAPR